MLSAVPFFIQQVGPHHLTNIDIALRDNKSGTVQTEKYSEIELGRSNSLTPRYIWFTPSTPWDEDYTATITSSRKATVIQRLIIRSTHHAIQLAGDLRIDDVSRPPLECRDSLLPSSYELARNSDQPCDKWMDLSPETENHLRPAPYNVELPDGSVMINRPRVLTAQSEAESQSDARRLSEWQRGVIRSALSKYSGRKILIMASSGKNTWAYAQDFRDVFVSSGWEVRGPTQVPPIDDLIIDVQLSTNGSLGVPPKPEVSAVMSGFREAGIKRRAHFTLDPDINPNLSVLWVGAKSPGGITPDDCAPIAFKPTPGAPEPCSMISQTPKAIPFPPP
jgi:hypothetical protein